MHHARLAPAIVAVLGFAPLSACDSELDPDDPMSDVLDDEAFGDEALDDAPELDIPAELDTLEILEPGVEDQHTVSNCLSASATYVVADQSERATITLQIGSGVGYGSDYDFDVTPTHFYDQLGAYWIRRLPQNNLVASTSSPGWNSFSAGSGTSFTFEMLATYSTPQPGRVYRNTVTFQGNGHVCSQVIQLRIPDCRTVGWWWTNPWPTPFYDTVNCYVATPPPNQQPFVWSNSWYVKPQNGNQCAIGNFDGVNCYVGSPPGGHTAFVYDGNFYFTP